MPALRLLTEMLLFVAVLLVACCSATSHGQSFGNQREQFQYPPASYDVAVELYRDGKLPDAATALIEALNGSPRDAGGRWIDSIPMHALLGECHYQAGDLSAAMIQYEAAITIAAGNKDWASQIEWKSPSKVSLPRQMRFRIVDGVAPAEIFARHGDAGAVMIDAVEIFRGLATALYRRRVILGPLSIQDALPKQVFKTIVLADHPFGSAITGTVLTCASFAVGDDGAVRDQWRAIAKADGNMHPLSPLAMIVAARSMANQHDPIAAASVAIEAATAASALGQPEWAGEAIAIASGCVDVRAVNADVARQVQDAASEIAVSQLRKSRMTTITSLLAGADVAITRGRLEAAGVMLNHAMLLLQRRDVFLPRTRALADWLTARLAAGNGDAMEVGGRVDTAIARVLAFANGDQVGLVPPTAAKASDFIIASTPRLFQLEWLRVETERRGRKLENFSELAASVIQPSACVAQCDPVEGLAFAIADLSTLMESRLSLRWKDDSPWEVLLQTDALHRERYLKSLPLGGRVDQARRLVAEGLKGQAFESMTTQIAISRDVIAATVPPPLSDASSLQRLPDDAALLTFVSVDDAVIATLTCRGETKAWRIESMRRSLGDIVKLLRDIGVVTTRGTRPIDDPWRWRTTAVTLRKRLIPDDAASLLQNVNKIQIVPDGPLWYLPFELLSLDDEGKSLWADRYSIAYAPTPGFAVEPGSKRESTLPTDASSLVLSEFRSAATASVLGDGRDIATALMTIRCSGVDNVLISRWPVGGESTALLIGEYLQELPHDRPENAWRRAVAILRRTTLDPASEPLLNHADLAADLAAEATAGNATTGDLPLFWAGYLYSGGYLHSGDAGR